MSGLTLLTLILLFGLASEHVASGTVFILTNHCRHPVWPGINNDPHSTKLGGGGFKLAPGASARLIAPSGWSGNFWGRTGCSFGASGQGKCLTGDCGALNCPAGGKPPITLAEFTLATPRYPKDSYDISLVDGYNVEMSITPRGGTGECKPSGCALDLNSNCPNEFKVSDPASGSVVACKSACVAYGKPEYCCTGAYSKRGTCKPTHYSQLFKKVCPAAYSYAHDDPSSSFTCSGADYSISFCR